ncbi:MAG: ArsR/SmtB family transcription factor [Candidatus Hodarchaeota archaeon]
MESKNNQLLKFLKVLCDDTRLAILNNLKESEKNNEELQNLLNKSQSTISHQLNILVNNNLVGFEVKENYKYYMIKNQDIFKLLSRIEGFIEKISSKDFRERRKRELYDILT